MTSTSATYHTGGVPGPPRDRRDPGAELPGDLRAIVETGIHRLRRAGVHSQAQRHPGQPAPRGAELSRRVGGIAKEQIVFLLTPSDSRPGAAGFSLAFLSCRRQSQARKQPDFPTETSTPEGCGQGWNAALMRPRAGRRDEGEFGSGWWLLPPECGVAAANAFWRQCGNDRV